MDLGEHTLCLSVANLERSIRFYQDIGFEIVEDKREQLWAVVRHNNLVLSLFQGHIERNLMNFRGGDVGEIDRKLQEKGIRLEQRAHQESDGSLSAEVHDPDGNVVYFNTFSSEREQYLRRGSVFH